MRFPTRNKLLSVVSFYLCLFSRLLGPTDGSSSLRATNRHYLKRLVDLSDEEYAERFIELYLRTYEDGPWSATHVNGTEVTWMSIRDVPRQLISLPECGCSSEEGRGFAYLHPDNPLDTTCVICTFGN